MKPRRALSSILNPAPPARFGEKYVARRFREYKALYWPEVSLPDWDELDFDWSPARSRWEEWASFDIVHGVPILRIHPDLRRHDGVLRETLLHEMVHMVIAYRDTNGVSRLGHGRAFWREVERIHALGCFRHYF